MQTGKIIGVLVLAIAALAAIGCRSEKRETGSTPVPEKRVAGSVRPAERAPAPDFRLPDLSGNIVQLSDYQGEVVLLNFWATWCGPCRVEAPTLQRLYERMADREFEILAVSLDARKEPVETFVARYGLGFPVLWDRDQEVARLYAVEGIPLTLLIDRKGRIVSRVEGARAWDSDSWIEHIKEILEENPLAPRRPPGGRQGEGPGGPSRSPVRAVRPLSPHLSDADESAPCALSSAALVIFDGAQAGSIPR